MKKPMYTLSDDLVHTRKLLQHVFGTHAVPSPLVPGKYISAELLGLDLVRLYLAGGSRPPLLALIGTEPCGADLFITWLQALANRAKQLLPVRTVDTLVDFRDDSTEHTVLVLTGPLQPTMKHLCSLVVQNTHFYHYNDKGKTVGREAIRASVILRQPTDEGLDQMSALVWKRVLQPFPGNGPEHLRALSQEFPLVLQMLARQPFMTKATSSNWFTAEQLMEPAAA